MSAWAASSFLSYGDGFFTLKMSVVCFIADGCNQHVVNGYQGLVPVFTCWCAQNGGHVQKKSIKITRKIRPSDVEKLLKTLLVTFFVDF